MAHLPAGADRPGKLTRKASGDAREKQARGWLEEKGLQFIAANVRERGGEIDLIMKQAGTLVFVEVRFRRSDAWGGAAASVDRRKQQRLLLAARHWLARQNGSFETVDCRFDVVAFTGNHIEWLQNAFGDNA